MQPIAPVIDLREPRWTPTGGSGAPASLDAMSGWEPALDPLEAAPVPVTESWARASRMVQQGDYLEAAALMDSVLRAVDVETDLWKRLRCGRVSFSPELGEPVDLDELRLLLMGAESLATRHLAAYQIAQFFELRRDWRKASFYATQALAAAEAMGRDGWIAASHNQLGNCRSGESRFGCAREHYESALRFGPEAEVWRALVMENLAYVVAVEGDLPQARSLVAAALRVLRRVSGSPRISIELDTAFVLLLSDDDRPALRHAVRALELTRSLDDGSDQAQNALFLTTEAAKRCGETFLARRCAHELATREGRPDMADALLGLDLTQIVNLKG